MPAVSGSAPVTARTRLVLPAPVRPTTATSQPRSTEKLTSSSSSVPSAAWALTPPTSSTGTVGPKAGLLVAVSPSLGRRSGAPSTPHRRCRSAHPNLLRCVCHAGRCPGSPQ